MPPPSTTLPNDLTFTWQTSTGPNTVTPIEVCARKRAAKPPRIVHPAKSISVNSEKMEQLLHPQRSARIDYGREQGHRAAFQTPQVRQGKSLANTFMRAHYEGDTLYTR